MRYIEPDWKRPPLERKILSIVERLEREGVIPTYIAIRRAVPNDLASPGNTGKEAILGALVALCAAGMLRVEHDSWLTTCEWRYWRSAYRGEQRGSVED